MLNQAIKIESEGDIKLNSTSTIKVYCSTRFNNNISTWGDITINDASDEYTIKVSLPTTGSATWSYVSVADDYSYITLQAITTSIEAECPITITIPKYFLMFANEDCTCTTSNYADPKFVYSIYDSAYYALDGTTKSVNAELSVGMNGNYLKQGKASKLPTITRTGYKLKYYTTSDYTTEITDLTMTKDTTAYIKWVADTDNEWYTMKTPTALANLKITNSSYTHTLKKADGSTGESTQNLSYREVKLPAKNVVVPSIDPTGTIGKDGTPIAVQLANNIAVSQFLVTGVLIESLRSAGYTWVPTPSSSNVGPDSSFTGTSSYNIYYAGYTLVSSMPLVDYGIVAGGLSYMSAMLICNAMTDYYNANLSSGDVALTHAYNLDGNPIRTYIDACTLAKTGGPGVHFYTDNATGFRLPTIDEWEYAVKVIPEPTSRYTSSTTCDVVKSSYPQYQYYRQIAGYNVNGSSGLSSTLRDYAYYTSGSSDISHFVGEKIMNNIDLCDTMGLSYELLDTYSWTTSTGIICYSALGGFFRTTMSNCFNCYNFALGLDGSYEIYGKVSDNSNLSSGSRHFGSGMRIVRTIS